MRISRRRTKPVEPKKLFRYNEAIQAPQLLVLGADGKNIGVLNTGEAIRLAREQEMDLVEINPKTDPPVARIMNFGQFAYQQEKAARIQKAHQHVTKTKCVRLSLRIGQHDLEIKRDQTIEFLNSGHKVKVEMPLRGRENQQGSLAKDIVQKFINEVSAAQPIKFDQAIERMGHIISAIIFKG